MLRQRNLPLAVLLFAVCLVYANSFSNGFHFDDFHTVTDNPAVRSLANLPRIATDTTAFSVLPANQTYRPVVTASLALDYALGHGYQPFWFHLSTLIWFLALVAALFFWAERLFDATAPGPANHWLALGLAAWFGLHPAMAETVNYVIQRGDLYCTLGVVTALLLYARKPTLRRFGLYLLPFALAMLSKPPAAVFAPLLVLYVFFFEAAAEPASRRWRRSLLAAAPAAAATALLLWLQVTMTPRSYAPSILSALDYRRTQPFVWLRYAAALLLPLHLNADTDLQPFLEWNAQALAGLLFAAALLLAIAWSAPRRRGAPVAYGLLWFLLTQLPTSLYTLSEVENDHRMFFSFPGLMLAVVWAGYLAVERLAKPGRVWLPRVAAAACGLALCGYAYGAHRRNMVWRDEASLWADDVQKSPHNGRGLMNYGLTRLGVGDYAGALDLFTRALAYTPNYPTLEINLGVVNGLLADGGRPELGTVAEAHFERAVALAPGDDLPRAYYGRWLLNHGRLAEATAQLEAAVRLDPQRVMQRDLLMEAYGQAGNWPAARRLAEETLALVPADAAALAVLQGGGSGVGVPRASEWINASLAAYRAGRFAESVAAAQQALKADPHSAEAWNNVGAGYGGLAEWDLAIAAEQKALALEPGLAIATNNLHWFEAQKAGGKPEGAPKTATEFVDLSLVLNQQRRYAESLQAAERAVALDANSAEAWNNIAAADEAMGRWPEAIAAAQRAVAIRPDFQLARNNLAWSMQQQTAARR